MKIRYEKHTPSFNGVVIVETLNDDEVWEHDKEERRRREVDRQAQSKAEYMLRAGKMERAALDEIAAMVKAAKPALTNWAVDELQRKIGNLRSDMLSSLANAQRNAGDVYYFNPQQFNSLYHYHQQHSAQAARGNSLSGFLGGVGFLTP